MRERESENRVALVLAGYRYWNRHLGTWHHRVSFFLFFYFFISCRFNCSSLSFQKKPYADRLREGSRSQLKSSGIHTILEIWKGTVDPIEWMSTAGAHYSPVRQLLINDMCIFFLERIGFSPTLMQENMRM